MKIEFNINDYILVRLNESGYNHLATVHNKYCGQIADWEKREGKYYKSNADENGYTKFQMWHFIELFGPVTGITSPMYFDTTILIEANI